MTAKTKKKVAKRTVKRKVTRTAKRKTSSRDGIKPTRTYLDRIKTLI